MAARRFLLLAVPLGAARALAPSFDTFRGNACGRWNGARYTWSRVRREELIEIANLGPESWYLGPPAKCATRVDEVMRSCGGAVQGVKVHLFDGEMGGSADIADDESYIDGDALTLNRQDDGFVYFDDGSWSYGPTSLPPNWDPDDPKDVLPLETCVAHAASGTRWRVRGALAPRPQRDGSGGPRAKGANVALELRFAEVMCEAPAKGGAGSGGGGADTAPYGPDSLLRGRLQVVSEAEVWEGGATATSVAGAAPASGWLAPRTVWTTRSDEPLEAGAPLLPASANGLPGGCFVAVTRLGEGGGDGLEVVAGSIEFDDAGAGEVVSCTRTYGADGALARVELRTVTPSGSALPSP